MEDAGGKVIQHPRQREVIPMVQIQLQPETNVWDDVISIWLRSIPKGQRTGHVKRVLVEYVKEKGPELGLKGLDFEGINLNKL